MAIDNKFANTRAISIGELLQKKQTLKVPRFQRNYDWGTDKVETLWNDMMESFERVRNQSEHIHDSEYLLGPVVLVNNKTQNKNQNEYFVIDGQQRLSTLTLLFCVARDIMHEFGMTKGIDKINRLIVNEFMDEHDEWKLELNDTDKALFAEIQKYEEGEESQMARLKKRQDKAKSNKLLVRNYEFLYEKLLEFLNSDFGPVSPYTSNANTNESSDDERRKGNIPMMIYFIDFVCEYNYVVMIMVNDDNTAFQIFETLNYRGKTLSKSNLIKNHILNRAKTQDMQRKQSDRWNRIFDEVVGNNQRDDDFIMESYNSRLSDSGSLRFMHAETPPMSKNNLYEIIKGMIRDEETCKRLIDELETDAEFLSMLNDPSQYTDEDSKDDVHAIKALKAKFIRVPLLAAYRKWYGKKPKDYSELVRFLVKFFFKIRVVRQVHPGKIESMASDAVRMINEGKSLKTVIAKLKEEDDHQDFTYNFKKNFMPDPQTHPAKYVLRQITVHLGTRYDDVKPIDDLTWERVLPQNHDQWDKDTFFAGYEGEPKIEEFKDRLGNLTLLQKAVNVNSRNLPFSLKKNRKDPDGAQVGYLGSKLEINKQTVCNHDEWTANIIEQREKDFAKYASKIWNLG